MLSVQQSIVVGVDIKLLEQRVRQTPFIQFKLGLNSSPRSLIVNRLQQIVYFCPMHVLCGMIDYFARHRIDNLVRKVIGDQFHQTFREHLE